MKHFYNSVFWFWSAFVVCGLLYWWFVGHDLTHAMGKPYTDGERMRFTVGFASVAAMIFAGLGLLHSLWIYKGDSA